MLKEVGASGQISLGKKYAGQLFDLQTAADGSLTLIPVKVVPMTGPAAVLAPPAVNEEAAPYQAAPQTTRDWALDHATEIAQYNQWVAQREPYAQRVRRWRAQG